jgi:hypothetical protein
MKTVVILLMLLAAPSLAAEVADPPQPADPLQPPHVWHVWGYKWDGYQWLKQTDHCLATSDFQQAADYYNAINMHHDWAAADDLPSQCYTRTVYDDSDYPQVPHELAAPTFQVWAFKQIDGKWVKQDSYSHEFRVPERAWQYQASVNAVPGWRATSDLPPEVPSDKQKVVMLKPVVDFPWPYWYTIGADGENYFNWNDGGASCDRCYR